MQILSNEKIEVSQKENEVKGYLDTIQNLEIQIKDMKLAFDEQVNFISTLNQEKKEEAVEK